VSVHKEVCSLLRFLHTCFFFLKDCYSLRCSSRRRTLETKADSSVKVFFFVARVLCAVTVKHLCAVQTKHKKALTHTPPRRPHFAV
jgi:hypothetical protein